MRHDLHSFHFSKFYFKKKKKATKLTDKIKVARVQKGNMINFM